MQPHFMDLQDLLHHLDPILKLQIFILEKLLEGIDVICSLVTHEALDVASLVGELCLRNQHFDLCCLSIMLDLCYEDNSWLDECVQHNFMKLCYDGCRFTHDNIQDSAHPVKTRPVGSIYGVIVVCIVQLVHLGVSITSTDGSTSICSILLALLSLLLKGVGDLHFHSSKSQCATSNMYSECTQIRGD